MPLVAGGVSIDNGTVLVLITLIVLPIAAIAFASSGGAWRQIGKGRFAIETETPAQSPPGAGDDRAAVAAEARQMLEAKSYLQVRRGQPPLDVEAELREMLAGESPAGADTELHNEVRRLVIVRNERRVREGQEPLDVEAETERQLGDLIGSRD